MPYEVAPSQLRDLRNAFEAKNGCKTTLGDWDITELVNANYNKTGVFEQEFAMVVDDMLAKQRHDERATDMAW